MGSRAIRFSGNVHTKQSADSSATHITLAAISMPGVLIGQDKSASTRNSQDKSKLAHGCGCVGARLSLHALVHEGAQIYNVERCTHRERSTGPCGPVQGLKWTGTGRFSGRSGSGFLRPIGRRYRRAGRPPNSRKTAVFRGLGPPQIMASRSAPIIPHMLRNCGSLRPKSLTRLGS
jgi:hypothetical protein